MVQSQKSTINQNKLFTLILMQVKNKLDLNIIKNTKELLRTILLSVLKFGIITAVIYIIFYLSLKIGLFFNTDFPKVIVIVLTISLILSIISSTIELTKNLYFSDDNKVLITFPVNANLIFISKIIVFYIYELKKSLSFLIPIIFASVLVLVVTKLTPWYMLIWVFIPLTFVLMLPVLLGSLFSIATMYIKRFLNKYSILQIVFWAGVLFISVYGIVYLIKLIPTNIDLINQWPTISKEIRSFLLNITKALPFMTKMVSILIGENINLNYCLSASSFIYLTILIICCVVLFIMAYYISRPFFFNIMAKSFEINKRVGKDKKNIKHHKLLTFIDKEFKINIRDFNIFVNYLIVYLAVPILILFLNVMYQAMNTRTFGNLLIYTFNMLMILLPYLASNSLVATYYSREGRAAYIKKTKPINVIYPLLIKLVFNVVLSIPSIFVTVWIFGSRVDFNLPIIIILGLTVLLIHLGHMIYSATLDIMNPQNEQYATSGEVLDNPNETKSTILAFIISFAFALITYKFFSESIVSGQTADLVKCSLKLMSIGLGFFVMMLYLFLMKVKAYYYEIQG